MVTGKRGLPAWRSFRRYVGTVDEKPVGKEKISDNFFSSLGLVSLLKYLLVVVVCQQFRWIKPHLKKPNGLYGLNSITILE